MPEHFIRITDKAAIESPLEIGYEYAIAGIITTTGATKDTDEAGDYKYTYKAKFTAHIEFQRGEVVVKTKDKKRNSQRFRGAVYHLQQDEGMTHQDEEQFYDQMTALAIEHLPELFHKYYQK